MKGWLDTAGLFALAGSLAWTMALMLLIPIGAGLWVDHQFGTTPWATLVGALAGVVFATIGVTRLILNRFERLAPAPPREEDSSWHD